MAHLGGGFLSQALEAQPDILRQIFGRRGGSGPRRQEADQGRPGVQPYARQRLSRVGGRVIILQGATGRSHRFIVGRTAVCGNRVSDP